MLKKVPLISVCLLALLASSISCSLGETPTGTPSPSASTGNEEDSPNAIIVEVEKNSSNAIRVEIDQLFENSDYLIGKRISITGETLWWQRYGEEIRIVIGEVGRPIFAGVYKGNSDLYAMLDNSKLGKVHAGRDPGDLVTVEGIFLGINQPPEMMMFPYMVYKTPYAGIELEKIMIP